MKKDISFAALAILAVAAITFGLAAMRPDYPATPSTPFSMTTGHKLGKDEKVVMRVNGEPVTDKEFMLYLQAAPAEMQPFYASPEGRQFLAQEIVKVKALEQEAVRLGIASEAEARVRLSIDRSNVLAGMALRKLVGTPSEQKLRDAYAKDRSKFEMMDVSHIAIAYQGGQMPSRTGSALPMERAIAKAQAIAARLGKGADFAALARAESDDTRTAENGGYIGQMNASQMGAEIAPVLKALKPGQSSEPMRTPFAIHIFRVGEQKLQPLEEGLKEALTAQIQRDEAGAAVERLQKAAKVELDPKYFPPQQKKSG